MTDTIAEVFRFENYVGRHFPDYILTKETESGDYVCIKTQKLYWLWQAAQNHGGDGHSSDPRAAEILGRAIHDAGVELGAVRESTELSGPQLLMVMDDIKELAQRRGGEVVAYKYELASAKADGEYTGWRSELSEHKPQVPKGSVRNLQPLYSASESAVPEQLLRNLDEKLWNLRAEKNDLGVSIQHLQNRENQLMEMLNRCKEVMQKASTALDDGEIDLVPFQEIRDLYNSIPPQGPQPDWTPCSEGEPQRKALYLAYRPNAAKGDKVATIYYDPLYNGWGGSFPVTHWMERPEPPEDV